jgi:hypothetical protein
MWRRKKGASLQNQGFGNPAVRTWGELTVAYHFMWEPSLGTPELWAVHGPVAPLPAQFFCDSTTTLSLWAFGNMPQNQCPILRACSPKSSEENL